MFDDEVTVPGVPPWLELKREKPEHEPISVESAIAQQLSEIRRDIAALRPGVEVSPTFSEIYDWFKRKYLPPGSAKMFAGRVEKYLLPAIGEMTSDTLSADVLDGLWSDLAKQLKPQTILHIRNAGRRILRVAATKPTPRKWPEKTPNPFSVSEAPVVVGKHREMLTEDECARLIDAASDEHRCEFAIAIYTGMRKNEILALRVRDINLETGSLTIHSPKNGATRDIPIMRELDHYLREQIGRARGELLFTRPDGSRRRGDTRLGTRPATALKHAGVVSGFEHWCRWCGAVIEAKDGARRKCRCGRVLRVKPIPKPIDFHGLRHICASLHRKAGCDPLIIQLLLGHWGGKLPKKSGHGMTMTEAVYTHFSEDEVRENLNMMTLRKTKPAPTNGGGGRSGSKAPIAQLDRALAFEASALTGVTELRYLKVSEVSKILRVSHSTVEKLIHEDKAFHAIKVRGQWRILESAFNAYLKRLLGEGSR